MRWATVIALSLAVLSLAAPAGVLAQEAVPITDPAAQPAPVSTEPTPEPTPTPTSPAWTPLPPTRLKGPTKTTSWVGRLLVTSVARRTAGRAGVAFKLLEPIAPLGAGPVWFEVRGVRGVKGVRWVKMLLPMRPNGTMGWMRADHFAFTQIHTRVDIDLGTRRLTVRRSGKRLRVFPVAVGTPATPSPIGTFAVAEVIPTGNPKAFLGIMVLPLTSFSNVLNEFAGGNGRVAIHGTSLPELIGRAVSHGCIRMHNADISVLSNIISPGTRVTIHN